VSVFFVFVLPVMTKGLVSGVAANQSKGAFTGLPVLSAAKAARRPDRRPFPYCSAECEIFFPLTVTAPNRPACLLVADPCLRPEPTRGPPRAII
jgi:hypothetical protein